MGTTLCLLTNSKLTGNETKDHFDHILDKFKALENDITSGRYYKSDSNLEEIEELVYFIDDEIRDSKNNIISPYKVEYEGMSEFSPTFYKNIGTISTIYRYSFLYEMYNQDWFSEFRKVIFEITKIMGGTEIIYVAGNACDKLSLFQDMAINDTPYEIIKKKMIKKLGYPEKEYSKLNIDKLDYEFIFEFFLDDFSDLK